MAVILEDLQARVRSVAQPEEDLDALIERAVQEFVARRQDDAAHWEAARAEAAAILHGPRRPFAASDAEFRARHQITDRSHMTVEERQDDAERTIAAMPADARADLERQGWL